jgi:menaquinone-specific isochorismate synthase
MAELEAGKIEKVVLTRQTVWQLERPLSLADLASSLARQQSNAFVFAVEGLVGASPELLVSFRAGEVRSLALAGTARSAAELETTAIGAEHQFAAESVESSLGQHVTGLHKRRDVLEFGDIFHLATEFNGTARPGATVLDILAALHPTAAVAGSPTKAAVDLISEIEPVSRRRYAGPVGWFNREGEGEFAIALRCGLFEGSRVTLYAGGGLVVGCERDRELAETGLKMTPMEKALGLEPV